MAAMKKIFLTTFFITAFLFSFAQDLDARQTKR